MTLLHLSLSLISCLFLVLAPIFVASSHVSDPELVVQEVNQCKTVGDATRNGRKTDSYRFGKHAIGGRDGKIYMVTDPRDKDANQLMSASSCHQVSEET
ncbi:hypothetical protein YC2023_078602 [Brassica napus]